MSRDLVQSYLDRGLQLVFWPGTNDWKGPREKNWIDKHYTITDYEEGNRVGIMHGVELAPGRFVVDVDIDYGPGVEIAKAMLPTTQFIWGRSSKPVSHCLYTCPDVIPMFAYKNIGKDGQTLIEFRADKHQSMAPPSVWEKEGRRELLTFVVDKDLTFIQSASILKQRVCLAAIGMLLGIHFGKNGFGHEPRLCWAGFLLRAGIPREDLYTMGDALSRFCNNQEWADVKRAVDSTADSLASGKKVKGGPALAKILGDNGKAIISRINEWLGRDSDFLRNSDGQIIKDSQDNVRRAVSLLGVEVSYQEFAEKMLVKESEGPVRPLDDRMLNSVWLRIDREHRFRPSFAFYEKVITDAAYENSFHPVRDYLAGLTWDGEPRLNTWLAAYGGAIETAEGSEAQTYLEAISSIVLIAAVRRVLHPGCKYDEMLVLESKQGLNKSGALRALCPYDEWFSDDLPLNCDAKEIIERTLGKWIIEASDLVGGRKADRDHLKSMLSRQIDGPARMAYAHIPVERPRQFIIVGTTNSAEYMADSTGARRFWPVKVQRFAVEAVLRDRDQLWAEAVVREAKGESIRLTEDLWNSAGEHQEQRREVDAWEEILTEALNAVVPGSTGRQRITADALWSAIGVQPERRDRNGAKRISEIMQRLGCERCTVRENDRVQTGYARHVATSSPGPRAVVQKKNLDM